MTKPTADPQGRTALSPFAMPRAGWKAVLKRTYAEIGTDNIGLIAAGVAFYAFLSIVPLLGAMVLTYGLIADPDTVVHDIRALTAVMPADAARLMGEQLMTVVGTSGGKKGFGLLLALALALYGATKAASAIVTALNIAYEEVEDRGFVKLNLLALAITVGAVLTAIVAMIAIAALGHAEALLPGLPEPLLWVGRILSYAVMAAIGAAAAATLYRYGPARRRARWTWLTPGSIVATLLWLALTLGFGVYVAHFGNYDATYGSLSAVVVLLTWIWLSAYVLLLGAELNSELERQTAEDTTRGAPRPMGTRGATVADTVAGDAPVAKAPVVAPDVTAGAMQRPGAGIGRTMVAAKAGTVVTRLAGGGKVGMGPALLVVSGLRYLRRGETRAGLGVALLVLGGGLAWRGRVR